MNAARQRRAGPGCAEFLPAAIEIEVTPPAPLGRAILWAVIALCVTAVVWASVSRVDIVAVAPGKLVPSGQVKVIQSPNGGIVTAIRIVEGQRVRAGQALIELDRTRVRADLRRISAELDAAQQELTLQRAFVAAIAARGRLTASGVVADEPTPSGLLPPTRRSVLAEATAGHLSRLRRIDRSSARRRAELQATLEQADKLRRILPLITERAHAVATLAGQGLVARHSALELEQQRIAAERDLASQEASARATRAAVDELIEERRALQAEVAHEALARIAELETRVTALLQERIKAVRLATEATLRAPVDGELQQLAVHTLGGVVKAGETLAIVVPRGPALEVEAMVLNRDIGFIAPGQSVVIKLDAFPFTRYGTLAGTVAAVGADAVRNEQLGPVYPVRVGIGRNSIRVHEQVARLSPGMSASIQIRTGERRIIDYLLSPLARAADESLRER